MAEKEEVKTQEQDYEEKAKIWYGVVERYEKVVPHFLLVDTYFRNKVFFVCNRTLYDIFIDCYATLYPERKKNRAWIHDELESLYGFNLLVDLEAPERGYFIDDLGARLDETDANHWKVLRQRWKEKEDRRRRNLRERGKRFYGKIRERIGKLQDPAQHFLLVNKEDCDLLEEGGPLEKRIIYAKRYRLVHTDPEETLGIEIVVHPACRKGGMIIERPMPGAPKPR